MELGSKSAFVSAAVSGPGDGFPRHSLKILSCAELVRDKNLGLQAQVSSQRPFLLHDQAAVLVRGLESHHIRCQDFLRVREDAFLKEVLPAQNQRLRKVLMGFYLYRLF